MATQVQTPAGTFIDTEANRNRRIAAISVLAAFALVMTALALVTYLQTPAADRLTTQGDVVDGWMPAIGAANRAAKIQAANNTKDGWSSALLKPEQPAVDGWSSYLLRAQPEVVDGWASRYLVNDDD